ncbi:MAG: CooT family nickel-binding protein [Actinobacteria bacterium]|nr:CooT family nickel-binding protein [Actinomycetota bacterium]MBU4385436.1 CooT family nickel-binding protein [Actinomycetota bacterium]MBU4489133.1 CooT family nickel-binding protein [Actinomycetota bacterium]
MVERRERLPTCRGVTMCESNVYLRGEDGDRLVMEDAVLIEGEGGRVKATNILGVQKVFEGGIEEITFLDHRVIISD